VSPLLIPKRARANTFCFLEVFFGNIKQLMKITIPVLFLLVLSFFPTGCGTSSGGPAPLARVGRVLETDSKSYAEVVRNLTAISAGNVRVWVYCDAVSGEVGSSVNFLTFNEKVYRISYHSFYVVDIPSGNYRVTTKDVLKVFALGVHPHFQYGKFENQFQFEPGKEYFLHIDYGSKNQVIESVDSARGTSEMKSLTHWTKHEIEDPKYSISPR